ncbi:hypothetical protein [Cellulomonas alba]|uniref:Uncharacterized protein n=1 Tax=Cellulomonas alba TaxID=3053467 RepID=A0ABT7SBI0_9CELL|nr:hypothetical protein [Cellulomonas alba]MDM7853543.1 hypothetical protein [Cellulomonas alba]
MADAPGGGADDLVRRLVDANVTYVRAWGDLVTDWLGAVGQVVRDVPRAVTLQTPAATTPRDDAAHRAQHAAAAQAASASGTAASGSPAAPSAAALVLEGAVGEEAGGAFEIENVLDAPATASVVLDPFRDAAGGTLHVDATIRPHAVTLDAGESTVVVLRVRVPADAQAGSDYRSTLRIDGIPAGTVGVVLRRTDADGA